MTLKLATPAALFSLRLLFCAAHAAMVDPAIDDPSREWCYLAKSTTLIGVPYMPDAVQVTFDGALFTRQAELCFFYGDPLQPVMVRQKTFLEGWIPIVQADWESGGIRYELELFGAQLEGRGPTNTLQFARMRMRNSSGQPAKAVLAAGLRHSGQDGRSGGAKFSPSSRYEMSADSAFRDGKLVYCFPPGAQRERVPGVAYEKPFDGASEFVTARAEVCLTRYEQWLKPGEERALVFKLARVPVPAADARLIEQIRQADFAAYRAKTVRFWKDLLAKGAEMDLPEARLNAAWRASLVHLLLATRERNGERFQTSGLPYPDFFMIDFVDMRLAYDGSGHPEFCEQTFPQILKRQLQDGLFCDTSLSHGAKLWSSHGHMVYALAHHYLMTRDAAYGRRVLPSLRRAIDWMRQARRTDEFGLMPPAWPYDAEMIRGHYTSHNLWSLLGLRAAIQLARELGESQDARAWQQLHEDYFASFEKALAASAGQDRYVPTGLYPFLTGAKAQAGLAEYQTDQDWENMLLVYPTELLSPADPRVAATLAAIRRDRYREGIMTYRNGMHLHQYVTANLIEQYLLLGEQELALRDFYHLLLHSGSTHEGFENMVEPWQDRRVTIDCPPPHAWAAAKVVQLTRNMLALEYGGRAGLDAGQRDLRLFSVISPAWAVPGKEVAFRNLPTEMGKIAARMQFKADGAEVSIHAAFHHPPRELVVPVPWFVELISFTSNARHATRDGDVIRLSPDATRLALQWRERPGVFRRTFQDLLLGYRREVGFWDGPRRAAPAPPPGFLTAAEEAHPPEPLSFAAVLEAFRHEYARRFDEYVAAGGKASPIAAPLLLSFEQRRAAFEKQFGTAPSEPLDTARGATASAPSVSRGYSIPLIDLAGETNRQVIVDRQPGQYLGHVSTVLLEDGKTLYCVYPKGHGRGPIVCKRSTDGGLSWSDRLPVPASWATSKETPTIHRVIDAKGKKRLIVWSGLYPARLAVSEDDGQTWSELKPAGDWGGIVVMGFVEPLRTGPGQYLAMFHDDGRFFTATPAQTQPVTFTVYKTFSQDGGLTWSRPQAVLARSDLQLCEPGVIRSPDGKELAVLLRENSRRKNSHVIFSRDEGQTWSEPRELPGALTGDRHTGKYAPDGRLFISFRDTTLESPTKGDWVAWVGTYQDIVTGREGQYRVRLMHNFDAWDCAYPGVQVLPEGTLVTTTYGHWQKGQPPYIVSVRLKLAELDAKCQGTR